jgi:hypothetical protein
MAWRKMDQLVHKRHILVGAWRAIRMQEPTSSDIYNAARLILITTQLISRQGPN